MVQSSAPHLCLIVPAVHTPRTANLYRRIFIRRWAALDRVPKVARDVGTKEQNVEGLQQGDARLRLVFLIVMHADILYQPANFFIYDFMDREYRTSGLSASLFARTRSSLTIDRGELMFLPFNPAMQHARWTVGFGL